MSKKNVSVYERKKKLQQLDLAMIDQISHTVMYLTEAKQRKVFLLVDHSGLLANRRRKRHRATNGCGAFAAVTVMLVLRLFTVLILESQNWNIRPIPIVLRKSLVRVPEDFHESLIVTLNYLCVFKEILPCIFVITYRKTLQS